MSNFESKHSRAKDGKFTAESLETRVTAIEKEVSSLKASHSDVLLELATPSKRVQGGVATSNVLMSAHQGAMPNSSLRF